jgi:serine-type D-Ala-D-Ala carboxypeptidase/endopeptidase (penicillin-binding protein 4)
MKKTLFMICLVFSFPCFGSNMKTIINQNNDALFNQFHAHLGTYIIDNKHHKIYQHNANNFIAPASLTKLFTATAALLNLTPHYQFKTSLYTTGHIKNGILDGNLYVKFTGDPSLTSQQLYQLLSTLKKQNIHAITGKILIDATTFNNEYYPEGATVEDLSYGYGSPLSAIIIDKNKFFATLKIRPYQRQKMTLMPLSTPTVVITNKLILSQQSPCHKHVDSNTLNHYRLKGCLAYNKKPYKKTFELAIRNPTLLASADINQDLKKLQISYNGTPKLAAVPASASLYSTHRSPYLSFLLQDMLKKSDNIVANALLKTLGHRLSKKPGSWDNGVDALKKILTNKTPINEQKLRLNDGAGLSRYNLTTPREVANLLQFIQKTPVLRRYIIPALPIAGKDGTLETRLKKLSKKTPFYAKTGSMTGVSNLAGYLQTKHQGKLIVVIMADRFSSKVKKMRKWEDRLILSLSTA